MTRRVQPDRGARAERRWTALGSVCALVTLVGLATSAALGAYRTAVLTASEVGNHETQLVDHEARLDASEKLLVEIRTDVRWIRQHLEAAP